MHNTHDDPSLVLLTQALATEMKVHGRVLATAESCTGGWIAKLCTDLPGSSAWFERSFVVYSNAAKSDMLGVPPALIARHGAVSEAVTAAMAEGALARSPADCVVAVSGIAGPDGGTPDKPVGTVCFSWAGPYGLVSDTALLPGGRDAVRRAAVAHALLGLLEHVLAR